MQNDYKNYDWAALLEKLPVKKNTEERAKRRSLWKAMDMNGNGYLSLAEFDRGIIDVLNLPDIFKQKKIILRAFTLAKNKVKGKTKKSGDFVEWLEFRYILIYLRQYLEYFSMFCRLDTSDDFKINLDEFKKGIPLMEKWGVKIDNPEAEFNKIDKNKGGSIMFDEFAEYAIKKNLDLEDDDDFDDKA